MINDPIEIGKRNSRWATNIVVGTLLVGVVSYMVILQSRARTDKSMLCEQGIKNMVYAQQEALEMVEKAEGQYKGEEVGDKVALAFRIWHSRLEDTARKCGLVRGGE